MKNPEHFDQPMDSEADDKPRDNWQAVWTNLSRRGSRALRAGLMVATLVAGSRVGRLAAEESEGKDLEPQTTEAQANLPDVPLITKEGKDLKFHWPKMSADANWTFMHRGADGQMKFRPDLWSVIFPVQVELGAERQGNTNAGMTIPYEYARLFDSAKPLRAADQEKVARYIDQQLLQEFSTKLHGLAMNKDVYTEQHGETGLDGNNIRDIHITGTASPEGPAERGPMTIPAGSIDPENFDLATARGVSGQTTLVQEMEKLGYFQQDIEKASKIIPEGVELQFSADEMHELAGYAAGYQGADDLERIYQMIVDYNNGGAGEIRQQLDHIIAAKRTVEVTVQFDKDRKDILLIPLPLLAFLALPLLRRRRGLPGVPGGSGGTQIPLETPTATIEPPTVEQPELIDIPGWVREVPLPGGRAAEEMEERSLIDDLYQYFDDPERVRRGLDYRSMTMELIAIDSRFQTDEERELYLTAKIIEAWKHHDRQGRLEAGVTPDQADLGLDYERQPKQIQWARMHARGLVRLAAAWKTMTPEQQQALDLADLLGRQVRPLIQRRSIRT